MKKLVLYISLILIICIAILPAAATETVSETATELISETETASGEMTAEEFTEKLKETLIIFASSQDELEIVDRLLDIGADPDFIGEVPELYEEFEYWKSEYWDCKACLVYDMLYSLSDEEVVIEESWAKWYADTYFEDLPEDCGYYSDEVDTEEIDIEAVGQIVSSAESFSAAVIAVADYLGISTADAEKLISDLVILGDKYLADTDLWPIICADIAEHPCKYTVIGLFILIFFALVGFLIRRVLSDMVQLREVKLKFSQVGEAMQGFSQTFKNIKEMNEQAITNEEAYVKLVAQKEETIEALTKDIKRLEEENVKERRSMLIAESYNLQVLQLICERTALPLADKSAISLYFTKAQDAIKGELSEDDVKKIDEMAASIKVGETVEKA